MVDIENDYHTHNGCDYDIDVFKETLKYIT